MLSSSEGERTTEASNDNLRFSAAEEMRSALAILRDFRIPDRLAQGPAGLAFASVRVRLLGRRYRLERGEPTPGDFSSQSLADAAGWLEAAPCTDAAELTMKALAFQGIARAAVAYAAHRNDPASLIADADALAALLCGVAADALAIAGAGGVA
jgi:hypothetical protein